MRAGGNGDVAVGVPLDPARTVEGDVDAEGPGWLADEPEEADWLATGAGATEPATGVPQAVTASSSAPVTRPDIRIGVLRC
ncbi:MAG TPA: hypothetical protein VFP89_13000 [Propionibacteriaceae bacterium]|nr:hypothetical protein [Propionibacteriaceae bacterium]